MKFLVLLLLGVSSAFAANSAVLGQFPYHADIFAHNQESYKNCDGVLIRHNWVLSAAHCLYGQIYAEVQLGILQLWTEGVVPAYREVVGEAQIRIHPSFDSLEPYLNDIGLVNLPAAPTSILDHPHIGLIDLPTGDVPTDGLTGTLTGFSVEEPDYTYRLMFINAPIMSNSWCTLLHGDRITASKMCVDSLDIDVTCIEGNGGPLRAVVGGRDTVVGIGAVWSISCTKSHHGIFTRVGSHLTWINQNIN